VGDVAAAEAGHENPGEPIRDPLSPAPSASTPGQQPGL